MNNFLKLLSAAALMMLITILGLHLFEKFSVVDSSASNQNSGVIDQTINYNNHVKAAKFASFIGTMTIVKHQVFEYYTMTGEWAATTDDIYFTEADLVGQNGIDRMTVRDGVILADVKTEFGDGAVITLAPSITMGGASITWVCETNIELRRMDYCSYSDILQYPSQVKSR